MTNYKWYLFDLDNTILDFSKSSKLAFFKTLEYCEINITTDIYETYSKINQEYWQQYEKGNIDVNQLRKGRFEDFLKAINFKYDALKMSRIYLNFLVTESLEIKGALGILKTLSKTSNLALITNGLSKVQHKRIEKHDLKKYFKHIFISDEMGVSKPAKAFFDIVHKKIGSPNKNEVLVLGDNPDSDILGAHNFAYDALYFNYAQRNTNTINAKFKINSWKEFII